MMLRMPQVLPALALAIPHFLVFNHPETSDMLPATGGN